MKEEEKKKTNENTYTKEIFDRFNEIDQYKICCKLSGPRQKSKMNFQKILQMWYVPLGYTSIFYLKNGVFSF